MTNLTATGRPSHTVLFVCEDNARRSLIAEALFRDIAGPHLRTFSAGLAPADHADTFALSALAIAGLGPEGLWPKHWDGFREPGRPRIDTVVMFGEDVAARMPRTLPGRPVYRTWRIIDERGSVGRHGGVWRDMQRLRPMVAELVTELHAKIGDSVSTPYPAAAHPAE